MKQRDKFVRVTWEDSSSSTRIWKDSDSFKNDVNEKCTSVGYLVHADKQCVVVAAHKGSYDYAGAMRIPRRAVVKIQRLKL
jgi:hypothetical protein